MTIVATTRADLRAALGDRRPRAVVMTMGALHDGHVQLMREARARVGTDGVVVATVFVNPLQFGAGEDFDRYPRTLDADVTACEAAGVDVVFAPTADEVYAAREHQVTMSAGPLGDDLDGEFRPGHFDGMLTVVAILMHLTAPDIALFGEKDYQQLVLIRRMAESLAFPVDVIGVATVRDTDGLALSSRNRYLDDAHRAAASAIPRLMQQARDELARGADRDAVVDGVRRGLLATGFDIDYLALRSPELGPAPQSGEGRLLVAARIGTTRLIDNVPVTIA